MPFPLKTTHKQNKTEGTSNSTTTLQQVESLKVVIDIKQFQPERLTKNQQKGRKLGMLMIITNKST